MKLPYTQLTQHLTKPLAAIYMITGDELLLTQEALDQIRQTALKQGFAERIKIPTENDWGRALLDQAHTLSLFSAKKILDLDLRTNKFNKQNTQLLQEYAKQPAPDTVLLIHLSKIDSKVEQAQWFQALEKKAVVIPIWPVNAEQLPQWLMARAQKSNISLTKPQADLIAAQAEGNLLAAAQEIEKLSLLQLSGQLTPDELGHASTDNAHFSVFDLVDSALAGNAKRAVRILRSLAEEDTEPTLVLWAIARELRTMAEIFHDQTTTPLNALFSRLRIWEKRQATVRTFLKRQSEQNCLAMLMKAAEVDQVIKGMMVGNVWDELEKLILDMCH